MSVLFNPKEQFQRDPSQRADWAEIARNPLLHKAITHTQAQMSWAGFSRDHMLGVSNFIVMLLNLSEELKESDQPRAQHLTSYDQSTTTTTKLPN